MFLAILMYLTSPSPVQETCGFLPRGDRGQPSPCNYFGQPRRG